MNEDVPVRKDRASSMSLDPSCRSMDRSVATRPPRRAWVAPIADLYGAGRAALLADRAAHTRRLEGGDPPRFALTRPLWDFDIEN